MLKPESKTNTTAPVNIIPEGQRNKGGSIMLNDTKKYSNSNSEALFGQDALAMMLGAYMYDDDFFCRADKLMIETAKKRDSKYKEALNILVSAALSSGENAEGVKKAVNEIDDELMGIYLEVGYELLRHGLVSGLRLLGVNITLEDIKAGIDAAETEREKENAIWGRILHEQHQRLCPCPIRQEKGEAIL